MRRILLAAAIVIWGSCLGMAQQLETTDQARTRHSAENYQKYQSLGGRAPLGGYSEKLGDPAPAGTLQPGLRPLYQGGSINGPYSRPNSYGYPADEYE
ncbi:MAG: hypothetical protein DCC73_11515 [Proteobacteria bacterium]|nr:MAG: hypothetical protein DCC73_11515 [Pseudomonadota bacterium]